MKDTDFWEVYGKVTWTPTDWLAIGPYVYYSPELAAAPAPRRTYAGGTVKVTMPSSLVPGRLGRLRVGRSGALLARHVHRVRRARSTCPTTPIGTSASRVTYKVFTFDVRYYDTDLSRQQCFLLTGDPSGVATGTVEMVRRDRDREVLVRSDRDDQSEVGRTVDTRECRGAPRRRPFSFADRLVGQISTKTSAISATRRRDRAADAARASAPDRRPARAARAPRPPRIRRTIENRQASAVPARSAAARSATMSASRSAMVARVRHGADDSRQTR